MSEDGQRQSAKQRRSVLAELPRTRPQRASRRRETARAQAGTPLAQAGAPKATPKTAPPSRDAGKASGAAKRGASRSKRRTAASAPPPPTPRQGYEAEQEIAGTPVAPPSGTEMAGALAELAGELAQTGIAAGGRLLKGAFSRLTGA